MEMEQKGIGYEVEEIPTVKENINIVSHKFPEYYRLFAHLRDKNGHTGRKIREEVLSVETYVRKMKEQFEIKVSTKLRMPSLLEFDLNDMGLAIAGIDALVPYGFFGEDGMPIEGCRADFLHWTGVSRAFFYRNLDEKSFDIFFNNFNVVYERNLMLKRLRRVRRKGSAGYEESI